MNQLSFIIACVLTSFAIGQAFNIDFDAASGAGAGVPSAAYGGAAQTPGLWNRITSSSPMTVSLRTTEDKNSSFKLTRVKAGTIQSFADADLSADAAALMCDADAIDGPGDLQYRLSGLPAYDFWIYVYGIRPGSDNRCLISVDGGKAWPVGIDPADDSLIAGQTHFIAGASGGTITIDISGGDDGSATCGGIQLLFAKYEGITLRVDPQQTGPQDGFAWNSALRNLHDALATSIMADGHVKTSIYIKRGIYPTTSGTDRNASFILASSTQLYGGFEGAERTPAERLRENLTNGSTTLTGEIGSPTAFDNAYHVLRSAATYAGVLDGITITRGYADGPDADSDGGGAHYEGVAPVASSVTWSENHAARDGGAIWMLRPQGGTLCTYVGNTAGRDGGAIAAMEPTAVVDRDYVLCQFLGNHAGRDGGAIFHADANVMGSFLCGNTAGRDGGAMHILQGPLYVYASTIAGNTTAGLGGGAFSRYRESDDYSGSLFWGNRSSDASLVDQQISGGVAGLRERRCVIEGRDGDPRLIDLDGIDDVLGTLDDSAVISKWSTCTDQGDESFVPLDEFDLDGDGRRREYIERDIVGQWRYVDFPSITRVPPTSRREVDIGCFEVQRCWADYNDDDEVTAEDVEAYVADFVSGTNSADLNFDTFVSGDDFDAFIIAFDRGC